MARREALGQLKHVLAGVSDVLDRSLRLRVALASLAAALPSRNWNPRLIGLTTALECLLKPGDRKTRRRLSERAAVLLHRPGDQRDSVFKDVGQIYDARSTLVHGGELVIDGGRSKWMLMRLESILQGAAKKVLSSPQMVEVFSDPDAQGLYFANALQGVQFQDQ